MHGRSESALKKHNWALIDRLRDASPLPWLLGGDFNEILTFSEKQGGNRKSHHQLTDFFECLLRNDLADCKPSRGWFTWMKSGSRTMPIREWLDRFIADNAWFLTFPKFRAWSDYSPNSDHHFILLDTVAPPHAPEARGKDSIFHFDDCWAREPDCISMVHSLWAHSTGSFSGRLATICEGLRHWQSTKRATDWEAYWAQRSRVFWLSAGDQNTSFLHAKASARKKKNAIMGLYDCNGYWQTSTTEVLRVASDYFVSLFSANPPIDAPAFLEHITSSVTADINSGLLAPFTTEEVIAAFRDINPRKSPGINGLPSGFFRQHWEILGEDFVSFCLDLLRGHTDMASVNETVIVLIPKVDKPTSMRQLRPISLCTVIYKTVSKQEGRLPGVRASKYGPPVNHLLFADDSLVFLRNNMTEVQCLKNILLTYSSVSGQKVNFSKSTAYFSPRTPPTHRTAVHDALGVQEVDDHDIYLGVPLLIGKNKYAVFGRYRDKVDTRVSKLSNLLLSFSGREVLIKSVAQALPQNVMSCYLLPCSLVEEMSRSIRRFWWSSKGSARGSPTPAAADPPVGAHHHTGPVKIIVDGAFLPSARLGAIRVIARDSSGAVLVVLRSPSLFHGPASTVEVAALFAASNLLLPMIGLRP
ncbi:hypothetical protein GQ457_01G020120 [Hibiscus cannabinus]